MVLLVCAVFAGLAVRELRGRFPSRARAIAIAACLLALLDLNNFPVNWRVARPIPPAYRVLAGLPRGAVAEFPFFERRIDFYIHTIYMLDSTVHWQPLVNGYSDYIPPDFRELAVTLAPFPSRESFEALKNGASATSWSIATCTDANGCPRSTHAFSRYAEFLRLVAEDDRIRIFEVVSWPK